MKPISKIVVLGGGTGLSVLLRGLKSFPVDITAIVTVADDGGSSGRLRKDYDMPPPGDVRNVLAALSEVEPLVERLFQHRFTTGDGITGHSLGNLLLAAMHDITGDFVMGIRELSKVLNVRGQVLPAANKSVILNAEYEDGSFITGESKIPLRNKRIKRVFLTPDHIEPLKASVDAINEADLIVIGPGSLYTSILPNLLVGGIRDAVLKSTVPRVYVCNAMTQKGETNHFSASDHVQALIDHVGDKIVDVVIVNNEIIPEEFLELYREEGAEQVTWDMDRLKSFGFDIISDNIIQYGTLVRHDAKRVSELLLSLLEKK
ncbi:gluconeogenesis factor YvcK family protein [Fictibacillus terranigra]|uniref:Gluconeogenesis factor n=1 Tax=Fictibacillus terranigra TaxID=3058424 RepID=A0ABT8E2K2_9BACL|nr:YvcK family protein [Fictibacillus sp. CENA-BCM004]MDN4072139.1 YvcK family protein [Fictibacillus sp. CENA-BCM004]